MKETPFDLEDESEVSNIIFNLETYSSHPIAKSLVSELKSFSDKLELTNIHEEKGISIKGDYNGNTYKIPSADGADGWDCLGVLANNSKQCGISLLVLLSLKL